MRFGRYFSLSGLGIVAAGLAIALREDRVKLPDIELDAGEFSGGHVKRRAPKNSRPKNKRGRSYRRWRA